MTGACDRGSALAAESLADAELCPACGQTGSRRRGGERLASEFSLPHAAQRITHPLCPRERCDSPRRRLQHCSPVLVAVRRPWLR